MPKGSGAEHEPRRADSLRAGAEPDPGVVEPGVDDMVDASDVTSTIDVRGG